MYYDLNCVLVCVCVHAFAHEKRAVHYSVQYKHNNILVNVQQTFLETKCTI